MKEVVDRQKSELMKEVVDRQKREITRLRKIYTKLPPDRFAVVEKVIDRAAYMMVALQDMEAKMNEDGLVIEMSQGSYSIDRAHPLLSCYNTMVKNFSAVVKQLNEMLPSVEQDTAGQALMDFVSRTVYKK